MEPGLIDRANIESVEGSESMPVPQYVSEATTYRETEMQTSSRKKTGLGALPGRVLPFYCGLCNVSFAASWEFISIAAVPWHFLTLLL
jgi:hypothetical protein